MLAGNAAIFGGTCNSSLMDGQFCAQVGGREVRDRLFLRLQVWKRRIDIVPQDVRLSDVRQQTAEVLLGDRGSRSQHDWAFDHVPPSRRTSFSSRTRSSLVCNASDNSPISSRKTVPPSASSINPGLSAMAPVKAPRTCPNSSLSIMPSGIVVQSIT